MRIGNTRKEIRSQADKLGQGVSGKKKQGHLWRNQSKSVKNAIEARKLRN